MAVNKAGKENAGTLSDSDGALFAEAIESIQDGFGIFDSEFRVLYANEQSRHDFRALYAVRTKRSRLKLASSSSSAPASILETSR
ncbi:MAG: hypothetical protein RLN89_12935, partial [Parvibaculum sp.]